MKRRGFSLPLRITDFALDMVESLTVVTEQVA